MAGRGCLGKEADRVWRAGLLVGVSLVPYPMGAEATHYVGADRRNVIHA
jgi:hypothetical protein